MNFEKAVIISVRGLQNVVDAGEDTIELVTAGRLRRCGSEYEIEYEESELTGMEGTKTSFRLAPSCITLTRSGAVNSQMVFELGKRHLSLYEIRGGALSIGVNTRKLHWQLDETGGTIEIQYGIEIDQSAVGLNTVHLTIREPHIAQ